MVHAAMAEVAARRGARADDARAARRWRSSATCSRRRPRSHGAAGAARRRVGARRRGAGRARAADLGALGPGPRRRQGRRRARSASRSTVGGATIRQGDVVVLDADGAAVVEHERVDEVLEASREREPRRSASSARSSRRARCPTTSTGCASVVEGAMSEPLHDLAHIGHAELLTPTPEESLRFFVDVLGMEIEAREGQSVYLRGWGDYQRYSLKLTESDAARPRPHGAPRLEPGGARAAGRGDRGDGPRRRLDRRRHRPRPGVPRSPTPTATRFELYYEAERYDAARAPAPVAEELAPALHRPRRRASSGSTTSTCSPPTSRANRALRARSSSATASTSASSSTTAPSPGAWMSLDDRRPRADLHRRPRTAPTAACTTSRSGSTRARSACARPTCSSTTTSRSRRRRPSTRSPRASSSTRTSPAATGSRSPPATHFVYDPDVRAGRAGRRPSAREGQAWGVKTIETFHTYGTPDISGEATGPPIPPTSRIPARRAPPSHERRRPAADPRPGRELGGVARRRRLGALRAPSGTTTA